MNILEEAKFLAQYDLDIQRLTKLYHLKGLSYWSLLQRILVYCPEVMMQSHAEYIANGGK